METLRNHKDNANQMVEKFQWLRHHFTQPILGLFGRLIAQHDADYNQQCCNDPQFLRIHKTFTEDNVLHEARYAFYREETFVLSA